MGAPRPRSAAASRGRGGRGGETNASYAAVPMGVPAAEAPAPIFTPGGRAPMDSSASGRGRSRFLMRIGDPVAAVDPEPAAVTKNGTNTQRGPPGSKVKLKLDESPPPPSARLEQQLAESRFEVEALRNEVKALHKRVEELEKAARQQPKAARAEPQSQLLREFKQAQQAQQQQVQQALQQMQKQQASLAQQLSALQLAEPSPPAANPSGAQPTGAPNRVNQSTLSSAGGRAERGRSAATPATRKAAAKEPKARGARANDAAPAARPAGRQRVSASPHMPTVATRGAAAPRQSAKRVSGESLCGLLLLPSTPDSVAVSLLGLSSPNSSAKPALGLTGTSATEGTPPTNASKVQLNRSGTEVVSTKIELLSSSEVRLHLLVQ